MKKEFEDAIEIQKKIELLREKIPTFKFMEDLIIQKNLVELITINLLMYFFLSILLFICFIILMIIPFFVFDYSIQIENMFFIVLAIDIIAGLVNYILYRKHETPQNMKKYQKIRNEIEKLEDDFQSLINKININDLSYTSYSLEEVNILLKISQKYHKNSDKQALKLDKANTSDKNKIQKILNL